MEREKKFQEFKKLLELKDFVKLKSQLKSYLKIQPEDIFASELLGISLFSLNEYEESKSIFEKVLLTKKDSIPSLLHLARIYRIFKDHPSANNYYAKIIRLQKNNYLCFIEYAAFLMSINKINNAISILNEAIKMNDDLFQAHSLMGKIFLDLTKYNNAINYLKKSVDINPKNAIDLNNLGFCYYKMEKINQSKEFYLKAIKANPLFAKAYSNLGLVHQTEGNLEEAVNYYIKCLEINPNDYEAFRLLSMSKKLNLDDKYVKEMVKIKSSDISKEDKILIDFSLAKVMEENKRYQDSAIYLDSANKSKRSYFLNFDIKQIENQFQMIIDTFSPSFFSKNKFIINSSIVPIFILGMPRSGTTLAEQAISNHPDVFGCGEINDLTVSINEVFQETENSIMLKSIANANEELFVKVNRNYISKLQKYSNNFFFTDKMPFNFKLIGLIKVCIPNAKIIHCFRNVNDNLLSIYKNYFSTDVMPWAYNKTELKQYYQLYLKLMTYYKSVLGSFIYDLEYEKLTTNPEVEMKKILKFCNLEWNENCINIENNKKPIFTASISQARNKINTNSHQSWKNFEKLIPELFF